MGWACCAYGGGEGAYRVLVGKPEGKRPVGRPRRRWVDDIRMDLQEVGCGYMDWIGLAQDRDRWRTLVSAVMNLRVPWNAGNFLTSCKPVSCSWRTLHHGVSNYTHSVKMSDFTVWRNTWGKNWINCAVLTGNNAGFRTILFIRLSHRELRSSLRESHTHSVQFFVQVFFFNS